MNFFKELPFRFLLPLLPFLRQAPVIFGHFLLRPMLQFRQIGLLLLPILRETKFIPFDLAILQGLGFLVESAFTVGIPSLLLIFPSVPQGEKLVPLAR